MSESDQRQADIQVTDAMVEAGIAALTDAAGSSSAFQAISVYEAMICLAGRRAAH